MNTKSLFLAVALTLSAGAAAQNYTPTEYKVTLHGVEMSTDGTNWVSTFTSSGGLQIDLANPATFSSVFGNAATITAGTYDRIRMTVHRDLVWSYPNPPVSKSNQTFTVLSGPPGPNPSQMTVYFATHDAGGRPIGDGAGDGTSAKPFLLGAGATVEADVNTTLRLVFVISNTLVDQGGGNYDLGPPQMFMVSENGDRSTLSGSFNTVIYNQVKVADNNTLQKWEFTSGKGTLAFDGAGNWTWTGTTNDFDLKNDSGALDTGKNVSGRYGTNRDGSFWMLASGEPGTLRGAVSSDGTMFLATMYDSPSSHLMIYGVQQATAASTTTLNGSYYFTTYGSRYSSGSTTLSYQNGFGTVNIASGSVTGNSDGNELQIQNPTTSPSFSGPTATLNDTISDTISITANGTISNTGNDISGGVLENGDAAAIAWNFAGTYTPDNQFGFIIRQSPANTFTDASLTGTYFGGHFGDTFRSGTSPDQGHFSGFFRIKFDGAGGAAVTLLENDRGTLATSTQPITYSVNTTTGIVTFSDQNGQAHIKGAIGPNAMSFILASEPQVAATPNDQRFLGLGLKQN